MATPKINNGNRFRIQAISLGVSLLAPFAIYSAMQAGNSILAALFFAILTLAMAVVVVKG
jgi:hypothetical protein